MLRCVDINKRYNNKMDKAGKKVLFVATDDSDVEPGVFCFGGKYVE